MSEQDETAPRTVVLADDHAIIRQATAAIVANIPDTQIVAEAADGLQAISAVRKYKPDLLVLDAAMPHAKGIEVLAEARRWSPDTRIAVLTGLTSASLLGEWLNLGTNGLLLKGSEPSEIQHCFETLLAGHRFVSAEVSKILKSAPEPIPLTKRESEILSLIATGHSNASIAERLCISIKTVEKHRGAMMAKLGVTSVAELFAYGLREGLLEAHKQL